MIGICRRDIMHSTAQHSTAQHSTAQHSLDYLGQGLFVNPFSKSSLISKELVGSFCVGDFLLFDNEGVAA